MNMSVHHRVDAKRSEEFEGFAAPLHAHRLRFDLPPKIIFSRSIVQVVEMMMNCDKRYLSAELFAIL